MSRPNLLPYVEGLSPTNGISATARACIKLTTGALYEFDSQAIIFERFGDDGNLIFKLLHSELPLRVDRYNPRSDLPDNAWLTNMVAVGRFKVKVRKTGPITPSRFMMSEEQARKLDPTSVVRYQILVQTDRLGQSPKDVQISVIIQRVLGDFPVEAKTFRNKVSVKTVRDWMKTRGKFQDRAWSDCISRSGKGIRSCRLDPWIHAVVHENALFYWSSKVASKLRAYQRLQQVINLKNSQTETEGIAKRWTYPALSTFMTYIDEIETFETYAAKFGEKAARLRYIALGKTIVGQRILEQVQIDHTVMDVMIVDGVTGAWLGRPTVTIMICTRSRCVLAVYISFDGPCLASVFQTLKICLRPKLRCAGSEVHPILQDIFGLPSTIILDNGLDFVGPSMQDAMADMGITIVAAKVKNPEFKPIVERMFQTLNDMLFHRVTGSALNKQKRTKLGDDYKPEAVLTLDDLEELIEQALYVYHIEPHESLGKRPPALIWQEDATKFGIPVLFEQDRLDALLAVTAERVLSNDGIELLGLQFNHRPTTTAILESEQNHRAGVKRASISVKVKYNPSDLSCIWVYLPTSQEYVTLPCVDQDYAAGLTAYQHKKIREHLIAAGLNFSSAQDRQKAREALSNKIYEIDPNSLAKERRGIARLSKKPAVAKKLENAGVVSVTGLTLLPHEPLHARANDGGAIPKGTVRGAAKGKRTRAENELRRANLQKLNDAQNEAPEAQGGGLPDSLDDSDWKGYGK
jgi:putative transposase